MKTTVRTTYILLGSVFLASSCSQEGNPVDIHDGSDRRIVFHTSLPGLTTKATEVASDLTYFHMTAFDETDKELISEGKLKEYFRDVRVEKEAEASKAVSDLCIWPEPGQEADILHFFAYYPQLPGGASLVNSTSVSDGNISITYGISNYTVAEAIADQVDFVTAYATGSMSENLFSGINLDFRHQLSRIEVKAKGTHKSCDIEIAGVAIGSTPMLGDFEFAKGDADGKWSNTVKGNATYVFRVGDAIVTTGAEPVTIMGSNIDESNENCAMLIPSAASAWDYSKDIYNENKGLYLNVLLRIIDKTPSGNGKQQYPYYDNSQGLNAMDIPLVLVTVDDSGKVTADPVTVYKDENGTYYSDSEKSSVYNVPSGTNVKEFGWAAVPVTADWQPGYVYTYTLDYTYGIGVHGPDVTCETGPRAGDPIISDRIGVTLGFKDWTSTDQTGIEVPGN